MHFEYAEQPSPDGLAQAFIIGEKFIGSDSACLVLGDNIFYGSGFTNLLRKAVADAEENGKATVFGYWVSDPERYGGFWRFPKMLDYCYLVNPYFNESRIIDEMEAFFRTLISEYPSGMKVNSLIASKCWGVKEDYIIPDNGAAELIKALMELLPGTLGITA